MEVGLDGGESEQLNFAKENSAKNFPSQIVSMKVVTDIVAVTKGYGWCYQKIRVNYNHTRTPRSEDSMAHG